MDGAKASSSIAGIFKAERGGADAGRRISHHELEKKNTCN